MLESLIRLTEAHARLLMKTQATLFDAISVIILMEYTLNTCFFGTGQPPSVLFTNKREYEEAKEVILKKLKLNKCEFD